MKLEKSEIDVLTCPPEKRDMLVFDDALTGFGMRVTAGGAKVFIFQYRRGALVRRMSLGHYGDITPAHARKLAEVERGKVAAGRDPVAEKNDTLAAEATAHAEKRRLDAVAALTLEKLVKNWEETGLRGTSAAHQGDAPAGIRRAFSRFLTCPAAELKTADLQKAIDTLAVDHPTAARHARSYASACANWGISRELLASNPFAALRVEGRPTSRDRALSDPELGAVWRAAMKMDYPFGPLFRLLILTLQRRTEVAAMRWAEVDPDFTTWTIPSTRAKNNKGHIVHLAEPARAALREVARRPRDAKQSLVFTTTGETPVSGFSRAAARLQALIAAEEVPAGAEPVAWQGEWVRHDLRRTGVTTLARLGVAPHVADRMLNHVEGTIRGVAAVYQRHEFLAERQGAAEQWAAHVLAVAEISAPPAPALPSNVVRLPARKKA